MKKWLSVFLSIIVLLGTAFLPVNAITVNYCEKFQMAVQSISDENRFSIPNVSENQSFPAGIILAYTTWNLKGWYGFGEKDSNGYYMEYAIPAKSFETMAKKLFQKINIDELRAGISCGYEGTHYNAERDEYIHSFDAGHGGASAVKVVGYTENGNKYTVYGYLGYRTGEKDYTGNAEYVYTDVTLTNGDREILIIEHKLKSVVSLDDGFVKFHSWELVDAIPDASGLITPDTKVDTPTENTSSTTQNNKTQASTSKQNASNADNGSVSKQPSRTENTQPNNQKTTSQTNNVTFSNARPNDQETASQINSEISSSATNTEGSASVNYTEKTDIIENTTENHELSSITDNSNEKPKGHSFVIVLVAAVAVILIGGGMAVYLLKFKKA